MLNYYCFVNQIIFFFQTDSIMKKSVKIKEAESLEIEVVEPSTFFDAIDKGGNAIDLIVKQNLAPWGGKVIIVVILFLLYNLNNQFNLGQRKNRKKTKRIGIRL